MKKDIIFSHRMQIEPSPTIMLNSLVSEMRKRGGHVYNLGIGELLIPTPSLIQDAGVAAITAGKTQYAPAAGIDELRTGAAEWMNRSYGTAYTPAQTVVTCGGKFGIYAILQALLDEGDEVILISPYWVSYAAMIRLCGGMPKVVETKEANGWKVMPEQIAAAVTSRTKMLILNSATNPVGMMYRRDELQTILSVAEKNNLFVVSDEVYSGLVYDDASFVSFVSCGSFPEFQDHVAVVESCSKNFAMTGWRVGFVFGPEALISHVTTIQSQSTTGTSTISQWAALAAVTHADEIGRELRIEMQSRRDYFLQTFQDVFHTRLVPPQSGLYAFVSLQTFGVSEKDSTAFCARVLQEAHVAMIPGAAFGAEGYVRLSFGGGKEETAGGLRALAEWAKRG